MEVGRSRSGWCPEWKGWGEPAIPRRSITNVELLVSPSSTFAKWPDYSTPHLIDRWATQLKLKMRV